MTIRVAITGIGIVSPFGGGKAAALEALRNGRSGVRNLSVTVDSGPTGSRSESGSG